MYCKHVGETLINYLNLNLNLSYKKNHCYIDHVVQVIYIESSGKYRLPFGGRYFSALIAQRLAHSLRNQKVPGSNHTVDKNS